MSVSGRRKDDSGAVALLYGIVALLLLSLAALGTDLGNMMARNTGTQTQADFAAFAAARKLTTTAPPAGTPVPATVVTTVRDYLNHNQPADDDRACAASFSCVTSAQLTDGTLANGEVRFVTGGLQVVSPQARVDFGFANIFGQDGTYVDATATVNVFSRGMRVMPMFAVSGCDYGRQTLTDPAGGHVVPPVPVLEFPLDTNPTDLETPTVTDSSGTIVTEITRLSTSNILTLPGRSWDKTKKIGFFPDAAILGATRQEQPVFWRENDAARTPLVAAAGDYTTNNSRNVVQVMIPDTVAATEGIWWVRVQDQTPTGLKWSSMADAQPIRVGGAVLECAAGASDGNFGTLSLPRTDVTPSAALPVNIAVGLQRPLTPTIHPWAVANPLLAGLCTNGVNGAVQSSGTNLRPGTNCVDTDTGLAANVATQGLITGAGGNPGMLTTRPTKAGCDPSGGSSNRSVSISGGSGSYNFNNDVLTCYLTNGTTSLATITNPSYNGPAVLDPDIFSAPRFIWVPVLAITPASGGSATYSVIDFRPAFITDEQSTTLAVRGSRTGGSDNGLTFHSNNVESLKVVFFDIDALPNSGSTPLIDFLGVGDPVVKLID
jgi:hypothetical protein